MTNQIIIRNQARRVGLGLGWTFFNFVAGRLVSYDRHEKITHPITDIDLGISIIENLHLWNLHLRIPVRSNSGYFYGAF